MGLKQRLFNYPTAIWGVFIMGLFAYNSYRFQDTTPTWLQYFTYLALAFTIVLLFTVIGKSLTKRYQNTKE